MALRVWEMAREVVASGVIASGRLEIRQRDRFLVALQRMRDGEVFVTVTRRTATRSLQQNRWYWGVIVELLSEHTGYRPEEIHDVLKAKFLPKRLAIADGNGAIKGEFVIGGSTTRLNTLEFGEYCEAVRQWALEELGVVIPDPEGL